MVYEFVRLNVNFKNGFRFRIGFYAKVVLNVWLFDVVFMIPRFLSMNIFMMFIPVLTKSSGLIYFWVRKYAFRCLYGG